MTGPTADGVVTPSASAIVATAEQYLGYPYAYIGDDPATGFSCIGFAHFVYAQNGITLPEDLASTYGSTQQVDESALQPGDLVFFQNTAWNGISHVDIYIGGGKMIGADSVQSGVQWDTLSDAYWQEHYLGATRPLASLTGSPVAPSPAPTSTATLSDTSVLSPTPLPTTSEVASSPTPSPTASAIAPSLTPQTTAAVGPSPTSDPSPPVYVTPDGSHPSLTVGMTVSTRHNAPVYSNPNDIHAAIDMLMPTMPLTVIQVQGQWVDISYADASQYGWVHGSDLAMQDATGPGSSDRGSAGGAGTNGRQSSAPGTTRVVQFASVPVYDSPSTGGEVRSLLIAGTGVAIIQAQGRWDQVALPDGTAGWIDDSALAPVAVGHHRVSTPAMRHSYGSPYRRGAASGSFYNRYVAASTGRKAVITADVLFVRDGPDRHARILRRVHAGDRVVIRGTMYGWDQVSLRDGSGGWVSAHWVGVASAP